MAQSRPPGGSGEESERRRTPRYEPGLPLEARGVARGRIHDISRTGAAIDSPDALDIGSQVDLELVDLPTGLGCNFRARVVWCQAGRVGLEFVNVTAEQDGWLASRFVEWLSEAAGDPGA
jgi:hypothetical protein